jgi:hypothetical protein
MIATMRRNVKSKFTEYLREPTRNIHHYMDQRFMAAFLLSKGRLQARADIPDALSGSARAIVPEGVA